MPRVSICIPNLNMRPFLPERIESIRRQTFDDWEAIIVDDGSVDGSWEFLQEVAREDPRFSLHGGPRKGLYPGWNAAIRLARAEFVYVATSDDTMAPDLLEKMVGALDRHPRCGIAHCALKVIDEAGKNPTMQDWWEKRSLFARSTGDLLRKSHIRKAPFDGLLHLIGESVYVSITQLLIRRALFEEVGFFKDDWGTVGDFGWNMRASLLADTIHVPDTWGGWRLHDSQVTDVEQTSRQARENGKLDGMISDAMAHFIQHAGSGSQGRVARSIEERAGAMRRFDRDLRARKNPLLRKAWIARQLLSGSRPVRLHLKSKFAGGPSWNDAAPRLVRGWLEENSDFGPALLPAESARPSAPLVSNAR